LSDLEDSLNSLRDVIHEQRNQIKEYQKTWSDSVNDPDDLVRISAKTFLRIFQVFDVFFKYSESLYIENAGLKEQIELLRDILVQIPTIKNNPQVMDDVNKMFDTVHKNNMERFKKFQDDFEEKK
jgi:hypothetical protein